MLALLWFALALADLQGRMHDPFSGPPVVRVFLFARTDCPITNRYAPEWSRIVREFGGQPVSFTVVYPDRTATVQDLQMHVRDYALAGDVLRDPDHQLVKRAGVTTAPEAAVFNVRGDETYRGRVDDLYLSPGRSRTGGAQVHDLEDAIRSTLSGRAAGLKVTRAIGCSLADVQ